MGLGIENDRFVGPLVRRARRLVRGVVVRVGDRLAPEDRRSLDPVTANHVAWRSMRRHIREWPTYQETPNLLEILVSPEDWEDYWGIDVDRKEQAIAAYVCARAAEKGYWIAGYPQVHVISDDAMAIGEVEVECLFVAAPDGASPRPASRLEAGAKNESARPSTHVRVEDDASKASLGANPEGVDATVRFVDADHAGKVVLKGEDDLRLVLCSGDCVGAVAPDDDVPPEVSIRLRLEDYPYAEARHFSIGVVGGRWCIINHASTGTKVVRSDGTRYMLREAVPFALDEGDTVYLGPCGPLRFECLSV